VHGVAGQFQADLGRKLLFKLPFRAPDRHLVSRIHRYSYTIWQ
jgi:hypothetical protein